MSKQKTIVALIVPFILVSCKTNKCSFNLDKSVKKLQDCGWTISRDEKKEEALQEITYYLTIEYINKGADLYVDTIDSYISLFAPETLAPDDPNWVPPRYVNFVTFSSSEDANKYYSFLVDESKNDKEKEEYVPRNVYLGLDNRIYIETNSKDACDLIEGISFFQL